MSTIKLQKKATLNFKNNWEYLDWFLGNDKIENPRDVKQIFITWPSGRTSAHMVKHVDRYASYTEQSGITYVSSPTFEVTMQLHGIPIILRLDEHPELLKRIYRVAIK